MKSGKKKIEIRLFDEKRQGLHLGDIITFSKLPDLRERLRVKVTGLLRYRTFEELVRDYPMHYFGYSDDDNKQDLIASIYRIYTKEQEQKYGVLGIRVEVMS
jgi:ASC-1-like (ASCH) protein